VRFLLVLTVLVTVTASGCFTPQAFMNSMGDRTSFELNCPREKLEAVDIGGGAMGVTGCDRRAVYQWVPNTGWVLASVDGATPER